MALQVNEDNTGKVTEGIESAIAIALETARSRVY